MRQLELRLFGVPRLMLDGEEVVISRPRVFECLARVIVAESEGITRSELCQRLWPNHDSTDARAQLRGTLLKLRAELEKLGITNQFDLSGESLFAVGGVACDFTKFTNSRSCGLSDLRLAVQPLVKSWDEENWREEQNRLADALASAFQRFKSKDASVTLDLLRKAARSHPTCTCLTELLINRLESMNRSDEANQAIIEFENAWLDRFGSADLPKLSLTSPLAANASQPPLQNANSRIGLAFMGLGGVCVLALLFASPSFRGGASGSQKIRGDASQAPLCDLRILSHGRTMKVGKTLSIVHFSSGDSRVNGIRRFSDGGVSIQSKQGHLEQENIIEADGTIKPGLPFPNSLIDRLGHSTVVREPRRSIVFSNGTHTFHLSGSSEYPICGDMTLVGPERVVARRVSDDPYHSRHETFLANVSGIQAMIQPVGLHPQILMPTFIDGNSIFVTYSSGREDKWHYHAGMYNLTRGKFTSLPYAKVAYRSSKGTLVVFPEVTTRRVIKGRVDFDTHWDGTVLLVHPKQVPVEVSVRGVNHFESALCFADSLILLTDHTSAYSHLEVSPIDAGSPSFELPSEVADLFVSEDCKALIYRAYVSRKDSDSYTLLDLF